MLLSTPATVCTALVQQHDPPISDRWCDECFAQLVRVSRAAEVEVVELRLLNSSGRLGAIWRLTEVQDGRVQCGRLLVNATSSKLNLELMCHSEDLYADLFVLTVGH